MQVVGNVPGERDRVALLLEPIPAIVDDARAALPDAEIHVVSNTFINDDINELINHDLDSSLRITVPLTFLILLLAFGAIVSLIPLVLAADLAAAAFGIIGLYSQTVGDVSPNATQLIVLIGLAVAVDYSLFMVTRFRTERRLGRSVPLAIEVASSTAGRAVFFSGMAVMISLAGLLNLGITLFTSMAVGTIGVVLVSVIGSLTFLPATLAIFGDRVNLGRPAAWIPWLMTKLPSDALRARGRRALDWLDQRAARAEGSGAWARLVSAVMSRPVVMVIGSAVLLLALAFPILVHLRIGVTDITGFPKTIDGVAGILLLNEKWPQGTDLRLDVVITHPEREEVRAAIDQLKVDALEIPGVSGPPVERLSAEGDAALISFTLGGGRNDEGNWAIVHRVRDELRPELFSDISDARMLVSGQAAGALDVTQIYIDAAPRIFLFVLGLSFLLMLVAFHSIVIPIKAILLNLLSTGAAFGVMVLVFRDGWLAEPLGITPGGVIESWVPYRHHRST